MQSDTFANILFLHIICNLFVKKALAAVYCFLALSFVVPFNDNLSLLTEIVTLATSKKIQPLNQSYSRDFPFEIHTLPLAKINRRRIKCTSI